MSSRILLRSAATVRRTAVTSGSPSIAATRRTITSSQELRHKESSPPDNCRTPHPPPSDNTSDDVTKHKDDLLGKHKSGSGHWKPELASNSEEAVKADRAAAQAGAVGKDQEAEHVKRLQERTKHAAEQNSKSGTSMGDGL